MIIRIFLAFTFCLTLGLTSPARAGDTNTKTAPAGDFGSYFNEKETPSAFSDPATPDPAMLNEITPAAGEETNKTVPPFFKPETKTDIKPQKDESWLEGTDPFEKAP